MPDLSLNSLCENMITIIILMKTIFELTFYENMFEWRILMFFNSLKKNGKFNCKKWTASDIWIPTNYSIIGYKL